MPAAAAGIRETDLGAELGFDRVAMRKRRQGLERGKGWWKDGATVMWSLDAAADLREAVNPTPEPEPDTSNLRTLRVVRPANNDRWVLCDDGNGSTVPVAVKRGHAARLLRKQIAVRQLEDGTLIHVL